MQKTPITVLFFGDSITAATRNLEDGTDLGGGYPKYAAEVIKARFQEEEFLFLNRGIWGNETKDAIERLQTDVIDLQPDIVVLFLGVNDTLRHAEVGDLSKEQFEAQYGRILSEIKEKTTAKLLVVEPYMLMEDTYNRHYKRFDFVGRIDSIRRLCKGVADEYMPLDGMFARVYVTEDASSYMADGLHPNDKGAKFIGEHCAEYLIPLVEKIRKG